MGENFGSDVSVRPFLRKESGGGEGGGEYQDNPFGEIECHIFLAEKHTVLLGTLRFFWRKMA